MLINRNVIRTIKNSTETTASTSTVNADTITFNLTTTDKFYVGFQDRFTTRYFQVGTVNAVVSAVTVKYWNGTAYAAVSDTIDQTSSGGACFAQSGFISWSNEGDWQKVAQAGVPDVELYWVEITVSVNLTAGTTLGSVLNLFCDDSLVRAYYPELISDTRYLPTSRTHFLDQYVAAKDYVVLRLTQMKAIKKESQIIDINEIAVAAVHAFAWILLRPIAIDQTQKDRAAEAEKQMTHELNQARLSFDLDDDGIEGDLEEKAENSRSFLRV